MKELESGVMTYVLNSLWLVPLFWLAAVLVARALRPFAAAWQHRVWVLALLLEAGIPGLPVRAWLWLFWLRLHAGWAALLHHAANGAGQVTVGMGPGQATGMLHLSARLLSLCSVTYVAVLLHGTLKLMWRFRKAQQLRLGARPVSLHEGTERAWRRCCARFCIKDARVGESAEIGGPLTLGLRRKLVLLPVGMLAALSETDVITIFAHECAHMQRDDFAKNLLYGAVALPIAYHPLYWATRVKTTITVNYHLNH